jgi:hypothetical protein
MTERNQEDPIKLSVAGARDAGSNPTIVRPRWHKAGACLWSRFQCYRPLRSAPRLIALLISSVVSLNGADLYLVYRNGAQIGPEYRNIPAGTPLISAVDKDVRSAPANQGMTGADLVDNQLMRNPDYFWHMWQKAEAQKSRIPQ